MLVPILRARVEQGNLPADAWVKRRCGRALAEIAVRAGQAQVLRIISAPRVNMVNVHLLARVRVVRPAVLAIPGGALVNKPTNVSA